MSSSTAEVNRRQRRDRGKSKRSRWTAKKTHNPRNERLSPLCCHSLNVTFSEADVQVLKRPVFFFPRKECAVSVISVA
ncbi:hypothetical protein PFLUV_G00183190 [Perca fluviatilis]|uniref:Uncharacterized protein n=1 Tax=Perca fluviatilis TaxID=8168 RepID=A0A6A5EM81_PERFL|nr:hypothetical protein PFLUV_G00183190 [Perca fluviatilis]